METADRFTGKIFKRMWLSAMVSYVGWAFSDIADAVVVGRRMGADGLAAIALLLPVYMINSMFAHGLGLGGSVRYSRLLGEGNVKEAEECFNYTMQAALGLSVLTVVLGNLFMTQLLGILGTVPGDGELFENTRVYLQILVCATPFFYFSNLLNYFLRNDNNSSLAGVGSVVANLTDIGLNILFVLLLRMGTRGAALATAAGQVVAVVIYFPGIAGKVHILRIKGMVPSMRCSLAIFREGFSSSATYLFQLLFLLLCNNVLIRAGSILTVAVFDLLQNASYLILYIYESTNRAVQPLVSTYHGEHRNKGISAARNIGFLYGGVTGFVVAGIIFIWPELICILFGIAGEEAITLGTYALRWYCVGTMFAGVSLLVSGYFQACGREGDSLLIAALRGGVVLLPVTLLFSWLGMPAFWWLFPVTEALSLCGWLFVITMRKSKPEPFDCARIWNGTLYGQDGDIGVLIAGAKAHCELWEADRKQTYFVTMAMEEICLCIMQKGFLMGDDGLIELVLVAEPDGMFTLHIRDTARAFNPFTLETNKASAGESFDMDAMGMYVIKSKAKEFFYRQYGGFNSLVVKI